ncbi:SHOCT domain-containing protein, partial [Halorubrum sp. SS5]
MVDDDETLRDRFRRNASGIAATTVTGTWLAALLLGFDWWLGFML